MPRVDPYKTYRFLVEIEGLVSGGFSEVSGLQVEIDVEDYREGGVNDYVHKLPKFRKYPNLILKRGLTDSDVLLNWLENTAAGKIECRNIRVILLDDEGEEKWYWIFKEAFPVKWSGADLKADGNSVAIETLELVHAGMDVDVA